MISEADMRKTGKKMLKHKITYVILTGMCIGMMALTAGCGGQEQPASSDAAQLAEPGTGEETVAESETEEETDRGDVSGEQTEGNGDSQVQTDSDGAQQGAGSKSAAGEAEKASGSDELDGIVVSVDKSNKFVVIDKFYTETDEESGAVYVHSGENELVKVYFLDDIRYTLEEITDDGGNVTKKEADFSDIREGDMLHLKGREAVSDISGDEFLSSEVMITRVV